MEKFKAVEKAMKTKAYSKEGLNAATKLDPKEQAKAEACQFLSDMVDELERQIEQMEAEGESIQATMKKGKNHAKAGRMAELEKLTERHKWHQGKLELIRRSLENGGLDVEDVRGLEEAIKYYVTDGMNDDYMDDDEMYDELNLADEEENFGMNNENDRVSSQDTQSIQEDIPEVETRSSSLPKPKTTSASETPATAARRPSMQLKSPLPALATLHTTPLNTVSNGNSSTAMKPATLPARPAGEVLKYASAAAAATVNEKNSVGIAPLPPPPTIFPPAQVAPSFSSSTVSKAVSAASSPAPAPSQPANVPQAPSIPEPGFPTNQNIPPLKKSPAPSQGSAVPSGSKSDSLPQTPALDKVEQPRSAHSYLSKEHQHLLALISGAASNSHPGASFQTNDAENGAVNGHRGSHESAHQLPPSLKDLTDSFEANQKRISSSASISPVMQRMMEASFRNYPDSSDAERPVYNRPGRRYNTPAYYPQDPSPIFNDPRLYHKVDPDVLFYLFYYRQNTVQQYLAAKALKEQSWRFHKLYQTWFQRHEEPKNITDEYEQGTYRFFDYESTWMNRRKAEFKFAYKYLEDIV